MPFPAQRLAPGNPAQENPEGDYVLYWMTSARRLACNFGLERAVEKCRELGKPLVILEALRADYPRASSRLHAFIMQGMAEKATRLADARALYYPYLERRPGEGKGLLEALGQRACLVVADDYPAFFLPAMLKAAGEKLAVRLELVDSNGLLPLAACGRDYPSAYAFRRFLQRELPGHLAAWPREHPLQGQALPGPARLPGEVGRRWPAATAAILAGDPLRAVPGLAGEPGPLEIKGGEAPALARLKRFMEQGLSRYLERNHPAVAAASGLSPWLHFGHVSAWQVLAALAEAEEWEPSRLGEKALGKREGWWGMSGPAESFADQVFTWRELGHGFCRHRPDRGKWESLPEWARTTLREHAGDPREYLADFRELEEARTSDPVWNAAQRQLRREGVIHNYLRMLWGKKILQWSPGPKEALERMLALNDRWAIDGRDPNSISGIFWCLGLFDRPFGPERAVFGKVRYMSSRAALRKLKMGDYLERFGPED